MRAAFDAADADGDGVIDRAGLAALLETTAGGLECPLPGAPDPATGSPPPSAVPAARGWLPQADVDAILAQYDANGDGVIDLDEYARLAADGVLLQGTVAEYAAAFAALDSGGNGRLGPTELADLMAGLGRPLDYDGLVRLMRDFDVDASGQLEFGEFLRLCRSHLSLDEVCVCVRERERVRGGGRGEKEGEKGEREEEAALDTRPRPRARARARLSLTHSLTPSPSLSASPSTSLPLSL